MFITNFDFILELIDKYDKNPVKCAECGKTLTFKKFYKQLDNPFKYCSKKCLKNNEDHNITNNYKSETEKIIYAYLLFKFPKYIIRHNITDIFPPYEIDMCLHTDTLPIYIEHNSSLHQPRKNGKLKKASIKHCLNDKIKKEEICNNRQQKLVRLWSKGGLYNKPELFSEALKLLKFEIDYLISANNPYGQCIDIVVEKDGAVSKFNTKFKYCDSTT